MTSYCSEGWVADELHDYDLFDDMTQTITRLLDKAYQDGIDNALEEIREGRYVDEGYTFDEHIKAKLEEAHRAGYEDGKADGFNQAGRDLFAPEDVDAATKGARESGYQDGMEDGIQVGRMQMAADAANHAEVV